MGRKGQGVDERSAWIRRFRDLLDLHTSDLGGPNNVTAAQLSIVRRVAVMAVELEIMEKKFAQNGSATPHALDLYIRGSGNLRRLLESIGLERRARDITPFAPNAPVQSVTPLRETLNAEVLR